MYNLYTTNQIETEKINNLNNEISDLQNTINDLKESVENNNNSEDNTVNESNNTDIIEQQENIIEEGKTPNIKTIVVITTTLISISIICYIVYHKLK